MNLHMFKYKEICLTQFPTCTPNLTIFPQVSGLNTDMLSTWFSLNSVYIHSVNLFIFIFIFFQ